MWAEGATAAAVVLLAVLAPATPAAGHSQPLQPSGTAPSQTRATPADLDGAAPAHAAADRATVPDAAALRDDAAPSTDTDRAAPGTAPGAAPDGGAAWQPSDVRPVHHPVPPRQQLTVPDERGPALEVLPFGTGLACLGLGLGLVGLRLRRA